MGSVGEVTLTSLSCYSSSSIMPVSSRYNFSSYGGRTPLYSRSSSLERGSLLTTTNGVGRYRSTTSSITTASSSSSSSSYARRPPLSGSSFTSSSSSSSGVGSYRRRCESGSAVTGLESLGQISEARKYLNERKALDNHPSTYRQRYQRSSSKDTSLSNGGSSVSRSLIRISASSSTGTTSGEQTPNSTTYRLDRMAEKIRSFDSSRSSSYCRSTERIAPTDGEVNADNSPERIMSVSELRQKFDLLHSPSDVLESANGNDTFRHTNGKYSPPTLQNSTGTHYDTSKSSPPYSSRRSSSTNRANNSVENRFSRYSRLQGSGSSTESDEKTSTICDPPKSLRSQSFRRLSNGMETDTTQLSSRSTKTTTSPTLEARTKFRTESYRNFSPANNDTKSSGSLSPAGRTRTSIISDLDGTHCSSKININNSTSSCDENPSLRNKSSPTDLNSSFSSLSQQKSVRSNFLTTDDCARSELPTNPPIPLLVTEPNDKLSRHTSAYDHRPLNRSSDTNTARVDLDLRAERIRGGRMAQVADPVGSRTNVTNGSEGKSLKLIEPVRDGCTPALSRAETSDSCSSLTDTSDSQLSTASAAAAVNGETDDTGRSARTLTGQHGLVGLRNIGNTCFMNAVLQCLSNTRALHPYILGSEYVGDVNSTQSNMNGALITAFSELVQDMWSESEEEQSRALTTAPFKAEVQRFAPRFMGYQQQDAQEFLRYLLEGLHEDVNRVKERPKPILTDIGDHLSDNMKAMESWKRFLLRDDSKFVDLFVGQLKSTLKCTVCGHESVTFDPIWDLSLPLPAASGRVRLQTCFDLFTAEEVLDDDEKPTCAKCEKRQKCTKSFKIHRFPRILVVHLKRFNPAERYRGKLNSVVELPLCGLDLSHYSSGHTPCRYNLYGIANHSGTLYSGHYIASCRHPYSEQWHQYNDSRVSELPISSVITKEAYVLFFELSIPRTDI